MDSLLGREKRLLLELFEWIVCDGESARSFLSKLKIADSAKDVRGIVMF